MFTGAKLTIFSVLVVIIISITGGLYWYISGLQETNEAHAARIAQLKVATELQQEAIGQAIQNANSWRTAYENHKKQLAALNELNRQTESDRDAVDEVFEKDDFPRLLEAKPELLERAINRGSERTRRLLQCATGSKDPGCSDRAGSSTN